jgi:hypothetical protein
VGSGSVQGTGVRELGEGSFMATCLFKKMGFDNENALWLDLRSQMTP